MRVAFADLRDDVVSSPSRQAIALRRGVPEPSLKFLSRILAMRSDSRARDHNGQMVRDTQWS